MRINFVFKAFAFGFLFCSICGCRFALSDASLEIGELSAETNFKE